MDSRVNVQMTSKQGINTKTPSEWLKYVYRIVILLVWATIVAFCIHYKDAITVDNILKNTPSNQAAAFLVLMALFAVKSVSVFIYCGIIYVASGLIFPFPVAMLADICGSIVMFSLPYFIGKRLGPDAVHYITDKYPKVELIKRLRSNHDFKFTFMIRIVGIFPLDLISLYMGAVRVSYLQYLLGSALALLPTMTLLAVMGRTALNPGSAQFILASCIEVLYMLISASFCFITLKKHHSRA